MSITVVQSKDNSNHVTIKITGKFEFSLQRDFRQAYENIAQLDLNRLQCIIDLRETQYMDSSALGMMMAMREHLGEANNNIEILTKGGKVLDVLKVCHFNHFFKIPEIVDKAG